MSLEHVYETAAAQYFHLLEFKSDQFKISEMCKDAVAADPFYLEFVPDQLKTREMCEKAVEEDSRTLGDVADRFKTREMCEKAVEENLWVLQFIPDRFKMLEMCENAFARPDRSNTFEICKNSGKMTGIPEWFVTPNMLEEGGDVVMDVRKSFRSGLTDIGIEKLKRHKSRTSWHL